MRALVAIIVAIVLAAGGFLAAYVPEHRKVVDAQARAEHLDARLSDAQALLRIHVLHDQLLDLVEAASAGSGPEEAQALSSRFFDDVRTMAFASGDSRSKPVLEAVLAARDPLTAALATRDPAVVEQLGKIRKLLHPLLVEGAAAPARSVPKGAPAPGQPAPAPAPAPGPAPAATPAPGPGPAPRPAP